MLMGVAEVRSGIAAAPTPVADAVLIEAMDAELHRAINSLGGTDAAQQPKPYFISYAVSDSESLNMGAQYGAITSFNEDHRRFADVLAWCGS